ncbi:MAG TPA: antibiotic biosynthesis monooxygenase [Gemmatimonadales bacterium]|nr:antibiotic biosynthesis monooxygenase [Gemmatimonadales bacterium]
MIARTWRGAVAAQDLDAYLEVLDRTGVAECKATPGNRGVTVLTQPREDVVEILFMSFWDDQDAVRAFAGEEFSRAVFYPEDERYLVEKDLHVDHWTVQRS